jgi:hypothetical protein
MLFMGGDHNTNAAEMIERPRRGGAHAQLAGSAAGKTSCSAAPGTFDHHRLDAFHVARDALRLGDAIARRLPMRGCHGAEPAFTPAVTRAPHHAIRSPQAAHEHEHEHEHGHGLASPSGWARYLPG